MSDEQTDSMLEEVASYDVELVSDPTSPELGSRYLSEVLAKCRNYTNRVLYYLQLVKRQEKFLRAEVKIAELDFDFKFQEKLADDAVVRQQPSISDRKAVATVLLKDEVTELNELRMRLLDTEETAKLLKARLDNLRQTNYDIKLQRQIVRDDQEAWRYEGEGYSAPRVAKAGVVKDGLAPPVRPKLDPKDLLDDERRPNDLPKPKDMGEAEQMAAFFNRQPPRQEQAEEPGEEPPAAPPPAATPSVSYDDLLSD